ncbi:MAG: DEAD/DEAH box helicase [Pseudomonadota bacterium]|nr:DEAD/DEAH box helicase [Pseudomonadota bacterium]
MSLADKLRTAIPPALWQRAEEYVRQGGVARTRRGPREEAWVVRVPGRAEPIEVLVWPGDEDWSCGCGLEACAHAAAVAIATARGAVIEVRVAPITYKFERKKSGLVLQRDVPPDAVKRDADAEMNRLLAGWWGRENLPKGLVQAALGVLDGATCTLDGAPIRTQGAPVLPRGLVQDKGAGFVVRLVRAPGIDEAFVNGALRLGDVLRPIGEPDLAAELRQRLIIGIEFPFAEARKLVTQFLPQLEKLLEVEVRTSRLPKVRAVPPRLMYEVKQDGARIRVVPRIVYGTPAFARVERGELVLLGGEVPVRDEVAERKLVNDLSEAGLAPGVPIEREGASAAVWAGGLRGPVREAVLEALPSLRVYDAAGPPEVRLVEEGTGFRVEVDASGADGRALVAAWQAGEGLVPLMGGGWRPLPRGWMEKHGAMLAELLSARDPKGVVPRHAAPLLLDAAEDLGITPPAGLNSLRALAGDFDAIPRVELPADINVTLRPYQHLGVDWIVWLRSIGMGGVLADDMGLGKTVQALVAVRIMGGKTLVVAPTSVLRNWASEAEKFVPTLRVAVYHGPKRVLDTSADIVVTTYALLRLDLERLRSVEWSTLILDEAQAIKNPDSQVALAARALPAVQRLAVTGTPVENRLEELWSAFHFVSPGLLGGRREFRDRFSNPIDNGDRRAQQNLRRRIRPFVLRRLKGEVAKDLPPRTDVVLRCTLSDEERVIYEGVRALARADVQKLLEKNGMIQVLEVLLRMRQAACHTGLLPGRTAPSSAKLDLLLETLDEVLAEGHKALVFSQWTSMLDLVEPALRARGIKWARLDGSTVDRAGVVARFSAEDGPPVFLLSLKAGGTGLNLTAADYVFHLDPWWNPAVEDQATDRAHRIGQDRPVVSCRLIAEDTVEERILVLQEQKRSLARAALDEEALARGITRDELLALFD